MASKSAESKHSKLFSYQEYIDKYCPKASEEGLLAANDPRIVGKNLAELTIHKMKERLSLR